MNNRERMHAIMHYESYDRMPVVSFGFWAETVLKWAEEGHISRENAEGYNRYGDNSPADRALMAQLGFDFNWNATASGHTFLYPSFPEEIIETRPDGSIVKRDGSGLIVLVKPGIVSIPAEIGTSMTGREAWEELYLPRLTFSPERVPNEMLERLKAEDAQRDIPLALHCGSLYGNIRNMMGVEELSYLAADDEDLYEEIIETVAKLCYDCAKYTMDAGIQFDYAHFWEDICFNSGPLVSPAVFEELVGPQYRRITDMLKGYGIDIVSVDCDGQIDKLVPIWLENGVNTMFPIEVGTWHASLAPWREKYGQRLRGVGGMDKRVFARDRAAVDQEIERLKRLVDMGGYIPCPDHRIAPDAEYDLVCYYCEQFRKMIK